MKPSFPGLRGSSRSRILPVLLAAVTAAPFVYLPGVLYPSVVPRAVYFRTLVAAAALLIALAWARGKWSPGEGAWKRERVGLGLVACTAAVVLAALAGAAPAEGLLGGMIRMDGAVAWVGYVLFYLVLRVVLDEESWVSFLKLVALAGLAVAAWSLVQAYGEHFGVALVGWGASRVVGTLGLEGPLAIYMLLGAAVAGYLATTASGKLERLAWGAVAALDAWVVVLTGTRSVLAAAIAAAVLLAAWAVLFAERGSEVRRAAGRALVALVGATVGLFVLGETVLPAAGRLVDVGTESLTSRTHLWRAAWDGFTAHPVLGVGPESFDLVFDRRFRAEDYLAAAAVHQDRAHNVLFGALVGGGLVGLAGYLAFWAAAFRAALAALRRAGDAPALLWLAAAVVAYFVHLQFWFEDLASFHVLLVILAFLESRRLQRRPAGEGGGGVAGRESEPTVAGRASGPGRWAAVGGMAALFVGLGWYHVQVAGAAREARAGLAAAAPSEAFGHFTRALRFRTATTHEITSRYVAKFDGLTSLVAAGRMDVTPDSVDAFFRRGKTAVEREIARHPDHSPPHARLARLHRARWRWSEAERDFQAARRELHRALEASPGRIRYLHRLARLHSQRGDAARAMEVLDEALGRFPAWWETYNTMAQVQWDAGNRERAVELLLRAARTDVRYKTAGTGTQFMVRAGSWLEARGTPMQAVELFEAYLGTRYPGWGESGGPVGTEVPAAALPIAARLPITLMHAGRIDEAGRAARRLRERLPPHLRRPVVTDRLDRFVADMEAGRVDRWRDAWGVLPTDVPLGG